MRKLSDDFLTSKEIVDIVSIVKKDSTLHFAIRDDYINVYYRGSSILKFDKNKKINIANEYTKTLTISSIVDWENNLMHLKNNIDLYLTTKSNSEKEFQQLCVRTNSFSNISEETHYFLIDIESTDSSIRGMRADIVGFNWVNRRNEKECQLSLIEMKYGKNSTDNMIKHFSDIVTLDKNTSFIKDLKEQTIYQFEQLKELGLINFKSSAGNKKINLIEKIEYIILLADFKPESELIKNIYDEACKTQKLLNNIEIKFAVASFMGYALFEQCVLGLDEFYPLAKTLKIKNFL